jgi:hypothetical protein
MKTLPNKSWLKPEILLLAVLSVIFHIAIRNNLEYHRDELLYFSLGMHPAAGYATVPPLIGWISWLMQKLFGYSLFAVRIFPAFLGGTLILLSASLARELGGSRYASFLSAIGLLVSIFFLRTYELFHPVHIEIFLWTLSIFFIVRYINTEKDRFLISFGITAGITLLNKYLAGILFIGLAAIIPFTGYREVLSKKKFWTGMAAGFLVFLPNLLWQAINGFPVFNHMHELYRTQLVHMDYPLFLKEQLLMPFAGTILTIPGLVYLLTGKGARRFRFLGFLSLFVIIALMLLKGKSYYTLGIFPLLIIAGAVGYEMWVRNEAVRIMLPVLMVLLTIPVIPIGAPVFDSRGLIAYFSTLDKKYGLDLGRRFEDGSIHSLPQDYADMLGWEEMTALAAKAWHMISYPSAAFIYGENYGEAGAITVIGKKYGLPEAISFNESFRYWIPDHFSPDVRSMVYINDKPGDDVRALFRKITLVGMVNNPDAREYRTAVYLCEDPVGSFNSFWIRRLKELGPDK